MLTFSTTNLQTLISLYSVKVVRGEEEYRKQFPNSWIKLHS